MIDPKLLVFMCCLARLQELELKRWDKGVFRPLSGEEQETYDALRIWYNDLGYEGQERLRTTAKNMAQEVAKVNIPSTIIRPS